MERFALWQPTLLGVVVTPIFYLLGMFLSGAGHSYVFMIFFFPYAMLLGLLFDDLTFYVGILFFALQFPLYGAVLDLARTTGRYKPLVIAVVLAHFVTVIFCFALDLHQKANT